ncbi:hypothetical protein HMPREF2883_06135 [Actinomyces sp. HMSC075C01]|uniref:Uncharacterized protein n=1 Tax=Actinomyces oris TaxID=544580 RepID=A0A1Q8VY31_9ACTO|nr:MULTISPECIES: hypothetical protein [Actinomyces]OFR53241.1 hypothetical protein HMPREF2883_06135 [Actinomyces sp. HMSC075C01]OLO53285.1 hypothetical protein BKH27_06690 [Actinomyces oris]
MESTPSPPTSLSPSEAEETVGTDTEMSPAHLDHDDAVLSDHPRLLACMRALLAGSVIALIMAVALFFAWNSGIKGVGRVAITQSWKRCALLLVLWLVGASVWPTPYYRTTGANRIRTGVITALKLLPVAGVAAGTAYACLPVLQLWRETASAFGVRLGELLAFAMGIAAFGLIAMAHIGLWAARSVVLPSEEPHGDEPSPEALDLWFSRPRGVGLRQLWSRAVQIHPFRRLSTAAIALLPAIALVAGFGIPYRMVKSTHADAPTITQTTAPAVDTAQLPAYPTSFGAQKTWVKDVDDFLDIAGGAAGPILLTRDTITGIDPANDSARWQYRRAGAEFRSQLLETDPVASGDLGLITSPNGRYVAVVATDPTIYSSMSPEWRELDGTSPVTTLVLDAVTGKVILEHPRQTEDHEDTFQLSDSALLDGTVAYSLTDGSRMWDLKDIHLYKDTGPNPVAAYAGTAGHASFIYGYDSGSDSLIVLPQADPSQPRKVTGVLQEQEFGDIITARGWIGVYDDRTPTQHHENDDLKARRAHAISLDALSEAPGADTRTFDLGTTLGINAPAFLSTGTISVFPATTPDGRPVETRSLNYSSTWKDSSSIGTVFNPATMTVAPLNQFPHYVTAVGIAATNIENGTPATNTTDGNSSVITTGDGHITIKTGDSRIIPLAEVEPGSTYYPLKSGEYNSTMKDTAVSRDDYHYISSLSTPGATLAIVNNTPNLPIASQSFRIYGFPG